MVTEKAGVASNEAVGHSFSSLHQQQESRPWLLVEIYCYQDRINMASMSVLIFWWLNPNPESRAFGDPHHIALT